MILVDFKDFDSRRLPSRKRDANVKINPLDPPENREYLRIFADPRPVTQRTA